MGRIAWLIEEDILSLEYYFKHETSEYDRNNESIKSFAKQVNNMYFNQSRMMNSKRTVASFEMKMWNYTFVDSGNARIGLENISVRSKELFLKYHNSKEDLYSLCDNIRNSSKYLLKNITKEAAFDDDFDDGYNEGRILQKTHYVIERNRKLINRKKKQAIQKGNLRCEVCGFDFEEVYGKLGVDFIECHHNKPVSEYLKTQKTYLKDLSLVCSNCHRMLHRRRKISKSIDDLKEILESTSKVSS